MTVRHAAPRNPFLLMTDPEVVFAAIASSERLSRLDRHLCRPLDREVADGTADDPGAELQPGPDSARER